MSKSLPLALAVAAIITSANSLGASPSEIREFSPQVPLEFFPADDFVANPAGEEADIEIHTSGAHYYKQAITSTKPRITSTEKFLPLPGANTRVMVPAGNNVLVNVGYTAESRCDEPDSTAPNWCEVRILIDGVEAAPAASSFPPDTYAFDSTDGGSETSASWESHAMDRHKCVFNSQNDVARVVPVEVEWKVTNFDGGVAPSFWLDDWSLTVELASGCRHKRVELKDRTRTAH